jgi:hypothetical protein
MARLRSLSRRQRKEAGAPVHPTNPHSAQGQWDIFFSTDLEGETHRSVDAMTVVLTAYSICILPGFHIFLSQLFGGERAENCGNVSDSWPGPIQLSLAVVNREETSAISAATVQPCPSQRGEYGTR